jgi:hypothetical protein
VLPLLGRCECHLLRGCYPSVIAPTGSCATPVGLSPASAFSLVRRVLAGCTQSLLAPGVCSHLFLPRCHRPSPSEEWVGCPRFVPRITTSRRSVISRLQIFLDVPASKFALPQDRSYRCTYCCRAARILRPGLSCFVTSTRTGYANRLNTGN